jgi:hypothetical protein
MGILLGFAPFIVFAVLTRFVAVSISLWAAAAVAAVLILRQKMHDASIKILEIGTFFLFAILGICAAVKDGGWDIPMVRTVVDGGLLLIILLSMLIRRPFTLQYAREQVPASVQSSPTFIKTNYLLTAVWALAMAVIVIADLTMHFFPNLPLRLEIVVMLAALGGAFWFTKWYPGQLRKQGKGAS